MSRSASVPDKPLSGNELKQVIKNDVNSILDQDGMLANHVAFKRVGYEITIKLHLDNPFYPEHKSVTTSREKSIKEIAANPDSGLEAVEAFPLKDPSEEVIKKGTVRNRKIISNNLSRVENEIPIQINVRNSDGTVDVKSITYSADEFRDGYIDEEKPQGHGFEDKEIEG